MKTINLRTYYYPHYTKDVFVEVSDEVAEVMLLSVREMEKLVLQEEQAARDRLLSMLDEALSRSRRCRPAASAATICGA